MSGFFDRRPWLVRDLLVRVMVPLLVVLLATLSLSLYRSERLIERVFDRWLLDDALSLTPLLRFDENVARVDLPMQARDMLLYDASDHVWLNIAQGERLLVGDIAIPQSGEGEVLYANGVAFYATVEGQRARVARITFDQGARQLTVMVAETLGKRQAARRELAWVIVPLAVLVGVALLSIAWAVMLTVRPIETVARRWGQHVHVSLEPVDLRDVPRELLPSATALNDLLARMRGMLARERQVAANTIHQIRTPLTRLELGLARAREATDVDSMRKVLDEVGGATQHTARLVQQMMMFGRLDPEARLSPSFRPGDLVALAQEVGAVHVEQAMARQIEFELIVPKRPVVVRMQRDVLAEALSNLIDNAIRYTPPGGRVVVEFAHDAPFVDGEVPLIRISDSGPGIPVDERASVLERFVRGSTAVGEGSGLGLAITREIAQLHGAQLVVGQSRWGGASFELRFAPLA